MRNQTTVVFCLTMILFLSACVNEDKIFDKDTKPTEREAKYFIQKTLKSVCVNPSSVKITLIGYIQYNDEFGWVVPCQFIWDGLHGRKERPLWYFGIDGSVKYGVEILGDDEKNLRRPSRAK